MALAAPTNPNLPSSWLIPGVFMSLNLTGSGAGLNSASKKLLLIGYKTSSGSQPSDVAIQVTQQSDANSFFGRGSDAARMYAAAVAQVGAGVCDIYVNGVLEPGGGAAATHLLTFIGTAGAAGSIDIWICGYKHSVAVANGDTASTIAANVNTAINLNLDLPVTSGVSSATVTLTARSKGVTGNDLPIIVNVVGTGSSPVKVSPGTITYATNASSSASTTVSIGGTTVTTAVTNGDTPTIVALAVAGSLTASSASPVTADSSVGAVTLYYATDRVVHRISSAITATGMTDTVACGTAGAGTPTLTTTLSNLAAAQAYPVWVTSFNETGSLGTISTHIEAYADGLNQKGQTLHIASTEGLATAGAIPVGASPSLAASLRYVFGWCVDAPQQAYELAARTAARVIVEDFHSKNYDGQPLQTRGTVPLMLQHKVMRPGQPDQNAAMYSYYMTPLVVDEAAGVLRILRPRTTSNSQDQRQWDWSWIRTMDYYRFDMNAFLLSRFQGKTMKVTGVPHTPNTINTQSVVDAVYERLRTYDFNDLFDDIESIKGSITANQNVNNPQRIDVFIPLRPPINLHQLGIVGGSV